MWNSSFLGGLLTLIIFLGCNNKSVSDEYMVSYYGNKVSPPKNNLMSLEAVLLGKRLFFDTILSANNKVSCATCHQPKIHFTDGVKLSNAGVSGKYLMRNTPTLLNIGFHPQLFWDGGAKNLESLVFAPISHLDEMGQDLITLPQKIANHRSYREEFKKVFLTDTITNAYIARALAQYLRTIVADSSQYDLYLEGKRNLSFLENKGRVLFEKHCISCHTYPFFTDFKYHRMHLDTDLESSDTGSQLLGRYRITLDSNDIGKYKTPTLRGLLYTAPYMHDGRYESLDEVVEHYSGLTFFKENNKQDTIPVLVDVDKEAIKAFLRIVQ